jgi:hypothetical protein
MEKCRAEDIDGDWIADLPSHVEATQLDLQTSDTVARLEALTYSGRLIVSEASIRVLSRSSGNFI